MSCLKWNLKWDRSKVRLTWDAVAPCKKCQTKNCITNAEHNSGCLQRTEGQNEVKEKWKRTDK